MKMLVLLNKYSNNGRGLKKWEVLRPELEKKYAKGNYSVYSNFGGFSERLSTEIRKGERVLVSAGGDGTVHFLLNQIMKIKRNKRKTLVMGAIGLGSSNDFHKPHSGSMYKNGRVPLKLDFENARAHNVGQVDFEDEQGRRQRRYFIINSSLGIIAQANYLFNSKERIIKWLKSRWVMGTIWYAALKTLFRARNVKARIKVGEDSLLTEITSLSVLITPYVSGNFRYDFNVSSQSDFLGVALCERMGVLARLKTIFSLSRSKFTGLPKTRTWEASQVEIYPDSPTPLELDGEVFLASKIKIRLLQGILKVSQ